MRAPAFLLLFAGALTGAGPVCERYAAGELIFTGTAQNSWVTLLDTRKSPIHKRSEKSKRVRFLVREWFKGPHQETVDLWMTPSDCSLILETNQTYLVYAKMDKESGRLVTNACAGTAAVGNAASDIAFLTAAQQGPDRTTRLSGTAGAEGLNVQAKSGIDTRYAVTEGSGKFTFDGLPAGDWELSVNAGPAKPVHLDPSSCVEVQLAAPSPNASSSPGP